MSRAPLLTIRPAWYHNQASPTTREERLGDVLNGSAFHDGVHELAVFTPPGFVFPDYVNRAFHERLMFRDKDLSLWHLEKKRSDPNVFHTAMGAIFRLREMGKEILFVLLYPGSSSMFFPDRIDDGIARYGFTCYPPKTIRKKLTYHVPNPCQWTFKYEYPLEAI